MPIGWWAQSRYGRPAGKKTFSLQYICETLTCDRGGYGEDDSVLDATLSQRLWGYPELVDRFFIDVRPTLAPIRKRNIEINKKVEEELRKRKAAGGDHLDAGDDAVKQWMGMHSVPDILAIYVKISPSPDTEDIDIGELVEPAETHVEPRRSFSHGPMKRLRDMARDARRSFAKHWPSRGYGTKERRMRNPNQ